MNYEHIVQINDPSNPTIEPLTRNQLWQGLVLRAEEPLEFMMGLDSCDIVERDTASIRRVLRFGQAEVRDRVHFETEYRVQYEIASSQQYPDGELCMQIEEPAAGHLILRFIYQLGAPIAADDEKYADMVKQAWYQSDLDTVRKIRELAASGKLG